MVDIGFQEPLALLLQVLGVLIVLLSQILFLYRARKSYGSVKKAFVDMGAAREGVDMETLKQLSGEELTKTLKLFPLSELLSDDFSVTALGLVVTLIGLLIELYVSVVMP